MRFWTREISGWLSIAMGLFGFFMCFVLLTSTEPGFPRLIESGPMALISIVLYRGGIQLLKVATAARICLEAQARVSEEKPAAPRVTAASRTRPRPAPVTRRVG